MFQEKDAEIYTLEGKKKACTYGELDRESNREMIKKKI